MRKFIPVMFGLALLLVAPGVAQAQCLLCGIVGYMIGSSQSSSSSNNAGAGLAGDLLYVMPRVGERLRDPLEIRQVVAYPAGVHRKTYTTFEPISGDWYNSLKDAFGFRVKDPENYAILAVQRIYAPFLPSGEKNESFALIFTYIANDQVIPLDQLPKPDEPKTP